MPFIRVLWGLEWGLCLLVSWLRVDSFIFFSLSSFIPLPYFLRVLLLTRSAIRIAREERIFLGKSIEKRARGFLNDCYLTRETTNKMSVKSKASGVECSGEGEHPLSSRNSVIFLYLAVQSPMVC